MVAERMYLQATEREAMKQAVLYARFSPRPNADECMSCEFQIEKCRAFCEARSFDVVGVYRDDGISGKDIRNRPGFQQALIHACKIHGVLVGYHLTRLSRGIMDAVHICETLEKHKADFAIVTQAFDTTTPSGRFMFYVMAAIGQLQREETGARTKEQLKMMHSMGLRTSGFLPYGYEVDRTRTETREGKIVFPYLKVVPLEQEGLRAMCRWRREGLTFNEICRLMIDGGFKPRKGHWHLSMVKRILNRAGIE